MPTFTDLPSFAIETSRKMFSVAGNVPFTATRSQTPLVAIRASVGTGGGALAADGVVVPGAVDGLEELDGVVEDCGPTGISRTGGAGSAEVVDVVSVGGADPDGAEGVVEALVVSCWTKGSLLLNRPKEISWF